MHERDFVNVRGLKKTGTSLRRLGTPGSFSWTWTTSGLQTHAGAHGTVGSDISCFHSLQYPYSTSYIFILRSEVLLSSDKLLLYSTNREIGIIITIADPSIYIIIIVSTVRIYLSVHNSAIIQRYKPKLILSQVLHMAIEK